MEEQNVRTAAREAVSELVRQPLEDSDSIVSSGLIDSLSVLKLISSLEKKLRVKIPAETLQPDDFDTVDLIVETVTRVAR